MNARPFRSVLVANRGEIAYRVIGEAQASGFSGVAVYSDADAQSPHVRRADQSVRLGPAPAAESYLKGDKIIEAAQTTGAEAIHPGYGFLSENAEFAQAVIDAGLVWIGPPPSAIEAMGDKARAKALMIEAGVPTVPGWQGEDQSEANLKTEAEKIGYPLLIKASAGGGGRGMRVVRSADVFSEALASAQREAKSSFGDDRMLLEKFVERGRHVEIQIFADAYGNVIHLGERDCSAQRRRQKVIEEAPSPAVSPELRERIGADAVAAAKAVDYVGAGTVEFMLADNDEYYFLEMNTRLQVEHPVTEEITGLNLVQLQFDVAAGYELPLTQDEVELRGWSIEARLYAEDPENGFAPQTGQVAHFETEYVPEGVRIDAGVDAASEIGASYDAMVAKIIATGADREEAIHRLNTGLKASPLFGVKTNRDFLIRLLDGNPFRDGELTTGDLDRWAEDGAGPFAAKPLNPKFLALASLIKGARPADTLRSGSVSRFDLSLDHDGDRRRCAVTQTGPDQVSVKIGDETFEAALLDEIDGEISWSLNGVNRRDHAIGVNGTLFIAIDDQIAELSEPDYFSTDAANDPSKITAPVSGAVAAINVTVGDTVSSGDVLAVMEAMKMEMRLSAEADGVVAAIHASAGSQAAGGTVLIELELNS
jgi:geranyl-CoA carboxylase alpha subunit